LQYLDLFTTAAVRLVQTAYLNEAGRIGATIDSNHM
jgi:hypothetical protein